MAGKVVDQRYYQVAKPGTFAERLVIVARDAIYADFLRLAKPAPSSSILDVGVSDVVGEAANVLERKYPYLHQITAVGLGEAQEFQTAFPQVAYRQINPGESLPFADNSFDIATSNAVLEHVGSPRAQAAHAPRQSWSANSPVLPEWLSSPSRTGFSLWSITRRSRSCIVQTPASPWPAPCSANPIGPSPRSSF